MGNRRRLAVLAGVTFGVLLSLGAALGTGDDQGGVIVLPSESGVWWLGPSQARAEPAAAQARSVDIRGVGSFTYDPASVRTLRPDLFVDGRFSAFDVLATLAERGDIQLDYEYDADQATHVVRGINGLEGWWYDVRLPGGTFERTALRMDSYPIKDGAEIYVYLEEPARLAALQASFREEVARRFTNDGRVVVPVVTIKGPRSTTTFHDVVVTSHDVRPDLYQPGSITALDVLLSLGDEGKIDGLQLAWHAMVADVPNVNHYMVDWISIPGAIGEATMSCGYMDSAATEGLRSYLTPHSHATTRIHLSSDLELLVSPGYVEWEWLCAAP